MPMHLLHLLQLLLQLLLRLLLCLLRLLQRLLLLLLLLLLLVLLLLPPLLLLLLRLLLLLLLLRRRRRLLLLARAGGVIAVAAARRRAAPRRLLYGCHRGTPLPLLWVAPPAQLVVELPVLDLAAVVHIDLIEESIRLLTRHVPQPEQGQPLAELLLGDGAGAVAIPLPEDLYK